MKWVPYKQIYKLVLTLGNADAYSTPQTTVPEKLLLMFTIKGRCGTEEGTHEKVPRDKQGQSRPLLLQQERVSTVMGTEGRILVVPPQKRKTLNEDRQVQKDLPGWSQRQWQPKTQEATELCFRHSGTIYQNYSRRRKARNMINPSFRWKQQVGS